MKPVHHFSEEYLKRSSALKPHEVLRFIEKIRLQSAKSKSRLISLKIPEAMLQALKAKAELQGIPYQTQIKKLIEQWLKY